ncbi:free fatty acid receptor 2-like [Hemicordylus capensis]|uniref:free fatty acid receptor 2-like n=1 Tax=Hemicordylus capensis TaxID=884348 RepID=UPI00230467F3|nr:free fatty acid receptor 2-like [Hemicordylus capensis]
MAISSHDGVVLGIYILVFLTGLPANLLAFYTFQAKLRQTPTPIDILLFNLTVSDVILLLFLPFKMVEAASGMTWPLPEFLCPLTGFCYYSSIYISTLFLTAISVERYLGVAYPIKYKLNRRPIYAVIASGCFWVLACSHCSIVYIVEYQVQGPNDTHIEDTISKCYENFSQKQLSILLPVRLELCVTLFCLPFLVCLFCYVNLVRILASLPNIQARRKQRAVGLAVATLLNFAICFAPYNISHIVGFIQNKSPPWRVYALLLSTLNASLDPAIFYFSSTAIQQTLGDLFAGINRKLQAFMPWCYPLCVPCCEPEGDNGTEKSSISNMGGLPSERFERGR